MRQALRAAAASARGLRHREDEATYATPII
jgi:hypothetical protein